MHWFSWMLAKRRELALRETKLGNAAAVQGSTGKAVGSNEPRGGKQEASHKENYISETSEDF